MAFAPGSRVSHTGRVTFDINRFFDGLLTVVLCAIFPPLGVFYRRRIIDRDFLVNVILSLGGFWGSGGWPWAGILGIGHHFGGHLGNAEFGLHTLGYNAPGFLHALWLCGILNV